MEMLQNNREIRLHIQWNSPKRRPQSISERYRKLKKQSESIMAADKTTMWGGASCGTYRHKQGSGLHLAKNHDDTSLMR